jgi:MinD-like ATPase involved in chromosome partitioning or flagellar assembly
MTPDIALAGSAREWPDRLHRHLLDHGGGRVVSRVLGAEQALESDFEVIFIDDVCSFLSPGLVARLRVSGAEVIGVFDPSDGSDAKRRLLECGISDVVESDAAAEEMLHLVYAALAHRAPVVDASPTSDRLGWTIGFTGATAGVGATEIAISLAWAASSDLEVALVDLDPHWPSVALRLDLPLHPNVRTAIDFVLHQPENLPQALHTVGALSVVGGVADRGTASPVTHVEAEMLLERLAAIVDLVVVDLGPLDRSLRPLVTRFDTMAIVGTGDPVGVTRLIRTMELASDIVDERSMIVIANKVPGRPFHMAEVRAEVSTAWPDLPLLTLPLDPGLAKATWEGMPPTRGPFSKAVQRAATLITEAVGA